MNTIGNIVLYTSSLIISAFIMLLWLRIMLRYLNVSSLHPAAVGINQWTNFVVSPVTALIGHAGTLTRRYDISTFIVLLITEFIKFIILGLLHAHGFLSIKVLIVHILADLIMQPINLLFYAVLIRALMSWFAPTNYSPITEILRVLTEPLFLKAREFVPPAGGIDFSPIVILIGLQVLRMVIVSFVPFPMV